MSDKLSTDKVACVEVTRPDSHGDGLKCIYRLSAFSAADEFDGAEEGEVVALTFRTMTEREVDDLPEFEGW